MPLVLTEPDIAAAIQFNRDRTRAMVRNVAQLSSQRAEEIVRKKIQQRYRVYLMKRILAAILMPTCLYLWWPTIVHFLDGNVL